MLQPKLSAFRMRLIRNPDPRRSWVIETNTAPVLRGEGDRDYACAACTTVLMASVSHRLVEDIAVKCTTCGRYNEVLPVPRVA